jgi:chromosome segregation ATPase
MERSNKCCSTVRELVRSAGMGHGVSFSTEDQWTPMAENTRLLEALGDMSEVHTREMTALVDACANEKARAQAKERECEFALIELAREKRLRAMEFEASRSTSIQAIEHLRKELNTAQDESAKRINSLENALTELRSEYTSERRRLKRVADEAVEAAKRREGWICALRNDLSLESARRFSAESKLADLQGIFNWWIKSPFQSQYLAGSIPISFSAHLQMNGGP